MQKLTKNLMSFLSLVVGLWFGYVVIHALGLFFASSLLTPLNDVSAIPLAIMATLLELPLSIIVGIVFLKFSQKVKLDVPNPELTIWNSLYRKIVWWPALIAIVLTIIFILFTN